MHKQLLSTGPSDVTAEHTWCDSNTPLLLSTSPAPAHGRARLRHKTPDGTGVQSSHCLRTVSPSQGTRTIIACACHMFPTCQDQSMISADSSVKGYHCVPPLAAMKMGSKSQGTCPERARSQVTRLGIFFKRSLLKCKSRSPQLDCSLGILELPGTSLLFSES